ncbi:hypothetical protein [Candidatus Absconditicoccus praedator]|uniref:hypothetical protein n=1 Tax=Candidatus Absconditicoccus praedator TaxID=2735562 RepID=UPI001E3EC97C|nr:hypothetical protein [Candidatus Absconditicoccus praedator]UFX83156.1 hypothetical protein HLG78_03415 [Candidatus Absconditicoccus praedator]
MEQLSQNRETFDQHFNKTPSVQKNFPSQILQLLSDKPGISKLEQTIRKKEAEHIEDAHPILRVLRLQENSNVFGITFKGIKEANDQVGHKIVDEFLGVVKGIILDNFKQYFPKERVVKQDYKSIIFNVRNLGGEEIFQKILGGDVSSILKKAIESNKLKEKIQFHIYKRLIRQAYIEGELEIDSKEDVEEFLEYSINSLEDIEKKMGIDLSKFDISEDFNQIINVLEDIDIGVGTTNINSPNLVEKMHALRQTEIASKNAGGSLLEYSNDLIYNNIEKSLIIESEILQEYSGKCFFVGENKFPVLIGDSINPALLRFVRKGEPINDSYLFDMVSSYMEGLNLSLDFIFPGSEEPIDEIRKAKSYMHMINKYIAGNVSTLPEFLTHKNYKGTLTKQAFMQKINGKKGLSVFVDIKDMGISNILNFRKLAEQFYNDGNEDHLLKAGFEVTKRFFYLFEELEKKFKEMGVDIDISLGGDELYVFVEGQDYDISNDQILGIIKETISRKGFEGRIVHEKVNQGTEDAFDRLNSLSCGLKKIEKIIDNIYGKNKSDGQNKTFVLNYEAGYFSNLDIVSGKIDIDISYLIDIIGQYLESNIKLFEDFLMDDSQTSFGVPYSKQPDHININILKTSHGLTLEYNT